MITLWHTLSVDDAEVMTTWLRAVGFTELATYRNDADPSLVEHSEWSWGDGDTAGGGVMLGSRRPGAFDHAPAAAYLVTDDVDGLVARAVEAGGSVVLPVEDKDYGGRGATLTDPEGNHWSVGSYQPR